MEWVLNSPQIHSLFGSLGFVNGDIYRINDDCLSTLEEIFNELIGEDKTLRTFRRAVGFGQNIKKDLIPILIHVKENNKITEVVVKILVNLTIPIECLLSVNNTSKYEVGQHTIFELNNLLLSSKDAFVESRATKAILDYIKQLLDDTKTLPTQLDNINNCLLLLRNILHIPEHLQDGGAAAHNVTQNKILWNLFSQSIDKILLYLITCTHGSQWSVTMAQLIALIYKDQHVNTLQKLLNQWLDSTGSDSSEDNESNTSPKSGNGSEDSSPVVTSDPTSDSSDTGGGGKMNDNSQTRSASDGNSDGNSSKQDTPDSGNNSNSTNNSKGSGNNKQQSNNQGNQSPSTDTVDENSSHALSTQQNPEPKDNQSQDANTGKKEVSTTSEFSDCGYGTQNQESISTSSNEDDLLLQMPAHQKPQKPRPNNVTRPTVLLVTKPIGTIQQKKEKRRKKQVKRGKINIISMKGLMNHTPTDDDITNVLKEFTVEFLVKGFGALVQHLHSQLLITVNHQIDTSHFFWLVTYFLKFSSQLEIDLEHIQPVLSFEILSYLTYEGVNLCEQLQLKANKKNFDLKPLLRRMHLLVTAIREFIQTINNYEKIAHATEEDHVYLGNLQLRISSSSDLRSLMLLLLRHYQQKIHTKQYLQDVIVTNHILLLFYDNASKYQKSDFSDVLLEHIRQFATTEAMHPYGMLLETFDSNGEFVNDCIFTMMHHVAGDLQSINTLFQPHILRVFSQIWETDFELSEDWNDLVEYVINTFIKIPRPVAPAILFSDHEIPFDRNCAIAIAPLPEIITADYCIQPSTNGETIWTQEDIDSLHWYYTRVQRSTHAIENIQYMFKESGIDKTKGSIINEMLKEEIISEIEFENLIAQTSDVTVVSKQPDDNLLMEVEPKTSIDYSKELEQVDRGVTEMKLETIEEESRCSEKEDNDVEMESSQNLEVRILVKTILEQNMGPMLLWLQKILLELCSSKYNIDKKSKEEQIKMHSDTLDTMEPIAFHTILLSQSTPVVPWSTFQSIAVHDQVFLALLDKLGFHLPADTEKYYIRVPHFWDCDILLLTAAKLGPIDKCKASLKFPIHEVCPDWDDKTYFGQDFDFSNISPSSAENDFYDRGNPLGINLCHNFKIPATKQMSMAQYTPLLLMKLNEIVIDPILSEDDEMKEDDAIEINSIHSEENIHSEFPTSELNSTCDSCSVTSDLRRMNVSDLEDNLSFINWDPQEPSEN